METVLNYEDIPLSSKSKRSKAKVVTKQGKKWAMEPLDNVGSGAIVTYLVRRHKFGLLTIVFLAENAFLIAHFFGVT
ncbi:MAG: hypothetical protein KGL39_27005 [Patescibacteria group bacterium]|nr:hypothetical protein [Patescibacteria group bacterium]